MWRVFSLQKGVICVDCFLELGQNVLIETLLDYFIRIHYDQSRPNVREDIIFGEAISHVI